MKFTSLASLLPPSAEGGFTGPHEIMCTTPLVPFASLKYPTGVGASPSAPGIRQQRPERNGGVALLAGLVLLAALSLLALAVSGSMLRQQHMAGNYADGQLARRAASVAIFKGRLFLFKIADEARARSCLHDCFVSPFDTLIRRPSELPPNPEFEDAAWWRIWSLPFGADPGDDSGSIETWNFGPEPPRFLIEELRFDDLASRQKTADAPEPDGIGYYRILARGVGQVPFSVAVDEAIVARPWFGPDARDQRNSPEHGFCETVGAKYDCGLMALRQLR